MEQITATIRPTYKQHLAYERLWDKTTRFLAFGGGAEGGKSWLGAEWLLTNCYRYPGTRWFLGRNELTRLMGSSYATFLKVCSHHDIPSDDWKFNGNLHYIEFKNPETRSFDGYGSRIQLLDLKFLPTDPQFQRLGSYEFTGGWIEEGGEVNFLAFDMLKSRIGRWKNEEYSLNPAKILITCNPEQNWLYRLFYKPWKKDQLPEGYEFIQALYNDNPYTAKEAGDRLNQITDPILRKRLKLGLWEYNAADNSLVTYDAITDLFTNSLEPVEVKYMTADVARYGSDKIVYGDWLGFNLYKVTTKKERGIDQTANDLKDETKIEHIPYSHSVVDDDGVGGGVVDINRGMKGFVGNSSALEVKDDKAKDGKRKDNYRNLRSQCGFMLADKIMKHEMSITAILGEIEKEELIEDLQGLLKKKDVTIEAALQLIPKEEVKEVLGRSPDYADMMLMRMWFELVETEGDYVQVDDVGGVMPLLPGTLA